jgi:subtilase family serine protease
VRGNATISPSGYAPDQIRRAYGFDRVISDGSGQVIGIVDAYDDPTIANDLQTFVTTFGLRPMNGLPGTPPCTIVAGPHPCFQKIYAQGTPRSSGNWLLETSLDVEWAHAIAPAADVLLVEAVNDTYPTLLGAVDVAVTHGARTVSISWGGPEFTNETHDDRHFNKAGVTFTTSSGDSGTGVQYPAASPYVVAVGGTTLPLDRAGVLTAPETAWIGSGGGVSAYESAPGYQGSYAIPPTGGKHGVPDVAYDADPSTGIAVYGSTLNQGQPGWLKVGGTSAGAPTVPCRAPIWIAHPSTRRQLA